MRKFHSYGPVNCKAHYCVDRKELVNNCTEQLSGNSNDSGHYFTIWAPRQTGKTWLIKQSAEKIKHNYRDTYNVALLSMQSYEYSDTDSPLTTFFETWQELIYDEFNIDIGCLNKWNQWLKLFKKKNGLFKKPLILFIDEFDRLPLDIIDQIVSMFREIYLSREKYILHGLALVGVRAVLGVDSAKGSPFNIQQSIHVPNLSFRETQTMFDDYQKESNQTIDSQVIHKLFEMTNGQPGLVSWFGELLTQKYNENPNKPIDMNLWKKVYTRSQNIEHNNTILNIIAKAKNEYKYQIFQLFQNPDIDFSFAVDWCNYMYMHGLVRYEEIESDNDIRHICKFASPFIQSILYSVFIKEMNLSPKTNIGALNGLDKLDDVFAGPVLDIPALLKRYIDYLKRLKDKGENPWVNQPRRKSDYHLTEAVGHFHLYYWLKIALGKRCVISPEFPTGNGKVDLHLISTNGKKGLIEVKSFVNAYELEDSIIQAARYATRTGHENITIALFSPFTDLSVLNKISDYRKVNNVNVHVVAIGQG